MRRLPVIALAAVAIVMVVILGSGGSHMYTVDMRLPNAEGLTTGSPVAIGGVEVGQVNLKPHQDYVDVQLQIEPKYAPINTAAVATILARNALGQKEVLLSTRRAGTSIAPDGYRLPSAQVDAATDLDQLLATLDPDTRSRLAIFLDQSGLAFAGRKLDFQALLTQLAPALSSGTDVLGQLTASNRSLRNLLTTSDEFIGTLAGQRRLLSRMIDLVGSTTETVAARRLALADALHRAPGALASARVFLAELRRATGPLAATARLLTAIAPPLLETIDRIEPFRLAAAPTLAAARAAAPSISALAVRTVGSLRGAVPALRSVQEASQHEIPAVGRTLAKSEDNLLATVDNWAHAIQFQDSLSHVFRGEAGLAPGAADAILNHLGVPLPASARQDRRRRTNAARPATASVLGPAPSVVLAPGPRLPALPRVSSIAGQVRQLQQQVVGSLLGQGEPPASGSSSNLSGLLNYLIGK